MSSTTFSPQKKVWGHSTMHCIMGVAHTALREMNLCVHAVQLGSCQLTADNNLLLPWRCLAANYKGSARWRQIVRSTLLHDNAQVQGVEMLINSGYLGGGEQTRRSRHLRKSHPRPTDMNGAIVNV